MFSENQGRMWVEKFPTRLPKSALRAAHVAHFFQKVHHPMRNEKLGKSSILVILN